MGFNPFSGRGLAALGTMGLSELMGENTRSKIPVLNELTGAKSDEEKQLLAAQQKLADDLGKRQKANEQARLNAIGQKMLAFNPQNQMMARIYGPEAAFSPQQMAQMAADPSAMSQQGFDAQANQALMNGQINPHTRQREMSEEDRLRLVEEQKRMVQNQQRMQNVQQNMQPLPPGPAALQSRAPQAARRY